MSLTEALRSLRTQNAPEPLSASSGWGGGNSGRVYGSGNFNTDSSAGPSASNGGGFLSSWGLNRITEPVGDFAAGTRSRLQGFLPLGAQGQGVANTGGEWFAMTLMQRYVAFFFCALTGVFCFLLAFFTLPMLVLAPQKFATAFTLGSLLLMLSLAFLKGLKTHFYHLISVARLPFTISYVGSMILTLYFSVGRQSYLGTLISSILQLVALVWYFVSYFPGGTNSLRFATSNLTRSASSLLPL
ncbi:protein transport protein sft2 [Tieghemiomyces parasiticus]|uniref:Protein transport protein SFT2 n=1 Tax=Tieghemiomyces parasiticus TaxID=78921 RepID=A0A9W7ZRX7_9FUNG|nr:protein transport protein sft2 [Tieghemiomyces parasiticus]KAJ1923038.1 protein transport protein sft2 [Tieghemiomyces parasiticus]